jgi:hypothetical protein
MRNVHMIEEEGTREVLCPRCRGEANWRFLDEAKALVEVACSDCGLFEMPRIEFEQAESDIAESNERH